MATKFAVALVGGTVIIVSIIILIIETLSSPSRCRDNGEISQTERNWVQKSEPVSSPSTIPLSSKDNFPSHSTNSPSFGDAPAKNSTPQPGTVLSTAKEANGRHPKEDVTGTVTPPEYSSTVDSGTTLDRHRQIIITPQRKCGSGEKKDGLGNCRPIWLS
jgi:hypothetical protein